MTEFNEKLITASIKNKSLSYENAMRAITQTSNTDLFILLANYLLETNFKQTTKYTDNIVKRINNG